MKINVKAFIRNSCGRAVGKINLNLQSKVLEAFLKGEEFIEVDSEDLGYIVTDKDLVETLNNTLRNQIDCEKHYMWKTFEAKYNRPNKIVVDEEKTPLAAKEFNDYKFNPLDNKPYNVNRELTTEELVLQYEIKKYIDSFDKKENKVQFKPEIDEVVVLDGIQYIKRNVGYEFEIRRLKQDIECLSKYKLDNDNVVSKIKKDYDKEIEELKTEIDNRKKKSLGWYKKWKELKVKQEELKQDKTIEDRYKYLYNAKGIVEHLSKTVDLLIRNKPYKISVLEVVEDKLRIKLDVELPIHSKDFSVIRQQLIELGVKDIQGDVGELLVLYNSKVYLELSLDEFKVYNLSDCYINIMNRIEEVVFLLSPGYKIYCNK